jgi:protein SCO1/2
LTAILAALPIAAAAQEPVRLPGQRLSEAVPAAGAMPSLLEDIGLDQKLNESLPLSLKFKDEQGRDVTLGDYFGRRPVILVLAYYECPMLCTQVMAAMTSTLSVLSLDAGKDFELVLVSFDPRETPTQAAARKREFLHRYKREGGEAGWHFLTGTEPEIKRLTKAAGFRYVWDEQTQQFAHPSGIIIVTPDGRPARYLFGIEYGPRDVRLALVEASEGKIGNLADNLLLFCYHYDPMTGRYGLYVMSALRAAGVATVLLMGTFIVVSTRREKKR